MDSRGMGEAAVGMVLESLAPETLQSLIRGKLEKMLVCRGQD